MRVDRVERQVRRLIGRIPGVMECAARPMSIRNIANALDYATNTPWSVVFAVQRLEAHGVIRRTLTRDNRAPWRWELVQRDPRRPDLFDTTPTAARS